MPGLGDLAASRGGGSLRLTHVSFEGVEFVLVDKDGNRRPVVVKVGSGTSWRQAVRFPTVGTDGTASTGNAALDRTICDRAAEELARLEATTRGAA
jgi:hypothetical protein